MKSHNIQAGVGHVAVVFVLVFLAVAGFAGYKVVTMNSSQKSSVATGLPTKALTNAEAPAQIKSKSDLVLTAKALDTQSSQVDSSLNDNGLNQDLNDML